MKTKTIRQVVAIKAKARDIYETLMDSKKHSKMTGGKAKISRKIGGKISAYDDYIEGVNLELIPNKKIIQAWRGSDWTAGHYSKAIFTLSPIRGGTRLTFTQSGVPSDQYDSIKQGWIYFYWKPMKVLLEK